MLLECGLPGARCVPQHCLDFLGGLVHFGSVDPSLGRALDDVGETTGLRELCHRSGVTDVEFSIVSLDADAARCELVSEGLAQEACCAHQPNAHRPTRRRYAANPSASRSRCDTNGSPAGQTTPSSGSS